MAAFPSGGGGGGLNWGVEVLDRGAGLENLHRGRGEEAGGGTDLRPHVSRVVFGIRLRPMSPCPMGKSLRLPRGDGRGRGAACHGAFILQVGGRWKDGMPLPLGQLAIAVGRSSGPPSDSSRWFPDWEGLVGLRFAKEG